MKKSILAATLLTIISGTAVASIETKTWEGSPEANKFLEETISLDFYAPPAKVGWTSEGQVGDYIDLAVKNNITGANITLGAPHTPTWERFVEEHKDWSNAITFAKSPTRLVKTVDDIKEAKKNGEYAIIWNSQTTMMLEGDTSKVETLQEMGVRTMGLAYNGKEKTGAGVIAMINGDKSGLTPYGKEVIDEMIEHGITVDLSHVGYQTTVDVIDYMKANHEGVPAVYTHSPMASTYKCEPHETIPETEVRMKNEGHSHGDPEHRLSACYRLISDQQAKDVAEIGGVVAVTFTEWMMDGVWPDDIAPKQAAQMIDGAVKVIGIDHVGIATDDMMTTSLVVPFAKANADKYADNGYMLHAFDLGATGTGELSKMLAATVDELWKMGYTNEDIQKLFGENLMRVYGQTWKEEKGNWFTRLFS